MLGSLLIQPQMLSRMQGRGAGDEIADEIVALAHLLSLNPAAAEAIRPAFEAAGRRFADSLLSRLGQRLPQALTELRSLIEPLTTPLAAFASGPPPASTADLLERIADGLERLAPLAGLLSDAQIRSTLQRASRILTDTLGLSQAGFRADFLVMLGEVRAELRTHPEGASAAARAVRESFACLLTRLEEEVYPRFPTLDLDIDRLAALLIRALRETPLPAISGQAPCLLGRIEAVLHLLAEITRAAASSARSPQPRTAAPATAPSSTSRRAPRASARSTATPPRDQDGEYCWYASWLYARHRQGFSNGAGIGLLQNVAPGYPGDEVWLSTDRKCLTLRRAGVDDAVLHRADSPFAWHEAPQFRGPPSREHFSFGAISPGFLEGWTQTTAILQKLAAGFWHAVGMGQGEREYACNIPLWLWHWTDGIASGAGGAPLPSLISRSLGWGVGSTWLFSSLLPMLTVIGGSFEGVHTRTTAGLGFLQWLTLIGGDALSAYTISSATQGVNDLFLSVFTLINQTGAGGPPSAGDDLRPANWQRADAVIGLVNLVIGFGFRGLIPRDDYGLPFDKDGGAAFGPLYVPWMFPCAPLVGAFANTIGTLFAWAIARTHSPGQLGEKIASGALSGFLAFIVEFYAQRDGSTDDGHYNPRIDPADRPYADAAGNPRTDFIGYPDKAGSPYHLPYAADTAMYVGQANLGFFSHARWNSFPQIYAYDFAHDFGDEVLAIRDGTVVDFFDWIPDNINPDGAQQTAARTASNAVMGAAWRNGKPSWNYIIVRHDSLINDQDRDQGGTPVTTYAVYGHGATGGVRELWNALYGKAALDIIGTRVRRGNPLMRAGSTGVSFHNHLHLHLVPGPGPGAATHTPPRPILQEGDLGDYTLPFVFADAPGDGVLRRLRWYRSANTRSTELPP
ncbi:hypothetical protein [Thauera sp.]|uniref:hypothetical protein n=1 Tax=Thauera sp. TaxID=1905334 RepID=UPI002D0305D8|nr:hypothetical protein [Thauera sp.]HRP22821.1 hypothetical protein [Thauera sp.]